MASGEQIPESGPMDGPLIRDTDHAHLAVVGGLEQSVRVVQ